MQRIITFLTIIVISASLNARDKGWSVQDCIKYALENNITLKQNSLDVHTKEIELSTAKGTALPSVSAAASQNFSFGRGLSQDNTYVSSNTGNTYFNLGADMTLFAGLRIKNNITMSKLNLAAAEEDLEKAKNDIRTAVAKAYVEILYAEEVLEVAKAQVTIDSTQAARLTAMEQSGKKSVAEVAAQEATLAKSRHTLVQAENKLTLAILEMTQLLELKTPEGFCVRRPDTSSFNIRLLPDPDEIYNEAVEIKPQIKAEMLRTEYARTNINFAKGSWYPTLSLSGGIGSNYYTAWGKADMKVKSFSEQMKNNFSPNIGLTLNIPIFNKMATKNQVSTAKISLTKQELALEKSKKDLYKEIQQAYYNALAAQSKYESCISAATSAETAFKLQQGKYEEGKCTMTEFNESKNTLLSALSDLVQAQYEYLYLNSILDFYRGKEISF